MIYLCVLVGWPSGLRRWFAKPLRANTPRAGSNPVPTAMPAQEININTKNQNTSSFEEGAPPAGGEVEKKKVEEKVLFSWKAVSRPFKRRNKEFVIRIIAMAAIVGLVLFFAEGFMPVILIVALVFLYYTLSTVEPEEIENRVTNLGINIAGRRLDWEIINGFWFSKKMDTKIMVLDLDIVPGRLDIVINPDDETSLRGVLKKYIAENESPSTLIDRSFEWVSEKLPGN